MNCANCKFWTAHKNASTGTCDLPDSLGYDIKTRKNEELKDPAGIAIFADATDDSGLIAELHTGVNFGCLKFTPTKPAPFEIDWTRIDNDTNGNPRYVCHFLTFITDKDREQPGYNVSGSYDLALTRAKKLGGRKFHNKKYGGGIVFQSYNIEGETKSIEELIKQYL